MNKLGYHCNRIDHIEERVLTNNLKRGEFFNFLDADLPLLKKLITDNDIAVSIHTPLRRVEWYPAHPSWSFLCDSDKEKRQLTLRMVKETLELAPEYKAEYVVVHFPSPVSSKNTTAYDELKKIVLDSCYQVVKMSELNNTTVHIEGFGPSPFFNIDFLTEIFSLFPDLRYCFDTGHMNIVSKLGVLDFQEFARGIKTYIGSIHLWTNRGIDDYNSYKHIPVHPSQEPAQGWADIAFTLKLLASEAQAIILEARTRFPDVWGNNDYRDGVKWVQELIATSSL